jgi:hypothetical protein
MTLTNLGTPYSFLDGGTLTSSGSFHQGGLVQKLLNYLTVL